VSHSGLQAELLSARRRGSELETQLRVEKQAAASELARFADLGPCAVELARRLQRWSQLLPLTARLVPRLFRTGNGSKEHIPDINNSSRS
jgi:hypothetical protein